MHIRKGDEVIVITGKDKGRRGRILRVERGNDRVVVEGINMRRHHERSGQRNTQGGIVEREGAIHMSNVKPWCASANKASRIVMKTLEDGTRQRVYKVNGETVPSRDR